ncbi:MAG: hypothetical protein ACXVO9_01525 [Bacteroidia bacterium]
MMDRSKRAFSIYMILTLLFEICFPSVSLALTSGPSQPEVQSFEPVGTSQMVDPLTGDFTYNIPLLEVDGYPINISYHSGITMDQEASWVGLGWNINPGVINRNMRGIPDDFSGESIVKELNMKPNRTFGLTLGYGIEFIGNDRSLGGVGRDVTVRFNNYTGVGIDRSITGHIPIGTPGKTPFTGSLGLTSSSDNGLTVQPNVSFSGKMKKGEAMAKMDVSVGSAFNSRAGLQHLTIGVSMQAGAYKEDDNNPNLSSIEGVGMNFSSSYNFGTPTYVPQLTLPFESYSMSGSFKLGGELEGVNIYGRIAGYFSTQRLSRNTISNPAYGYLNADEGAKYNSSLMDFNREKDATFSTKTAALAVPVFTYDILSVSGQGVGGSYRPFRSDLGQVFDPYVSNTSLGGSVGEELGLGVMEKAGVDVAISDVTSESGRWDDGDGSNSAHENNQFTQSKSDPTYERYYYKEANEKSVDSDPTFLQRVGNFNPQRFQLGEVSDYSTTAYSNFASGGATVTGTRKAREKRNQQISILNRGELDNKFGLKKEDSLSAYAKSYHMAEITSTTPDGRRYVYGIAAYNNYQEETTFAVGQDEFGHGGTAWSLNANTGLVGYNLGDNYLSNSSGVDNYLSKTKLPPYAHSYLLTAVLSADYVDSDTIQGPSANDLGTYTKFNYKRVHKDFKWRTPFDYLTAAHNEGLKWTLQDDKANYVYGEKEIWYLNSVETKNYIAVFSLDDRHDGFGVTGNNGGRDTKALKALTKISLYTKANYNAHAANPTVALIPLKEVHFEYDYSLCDGISNSDNGSGKLTLKKISFSYQNSDKGRLSPYEFVYGYNPDYHIKGYDRWGNYKPQDPAVSASSTGCDPGSAGLSNAEFPYSEQNKTKADSCAGAWALDSIKLPSGGAINIDLESDDYAYVQNKRAGQMFKVIGTCSSTSTYSNAGPGSASLADNYMVIELPTALTGSNKRAEFYSQYLSGLDYIYFRFLYQMSSSNSTYEYVPGYVPISSLGSDFYVDNTGHYAFLRFQKVPFKKTGAGEISPITKAALQFGRLNEAKNVWQISSIPTGSSLGLQLLKSLVQSSFVVNIIDAIEGPNKALYGSLHLCCQDFKPGKSWIRLNNPNMHKLGGGCRVKRITISDGWDGMTDNAMDKFSYGQEYSYNNEDGTSSGVANYEPQLGGDENPWHTPVFTSVEHLLAPDDESYLEEPFGEAFFPFPSIGYGRVTVQNLKYDNVSKHATGKTVHEFWTAKDFPTITSRTELEAKRQKTDPFSISSFLNIDAKDYVTASQGYYIELNDMHGKPKGQKVYQEGISDPISSIEYDYKKNNYLNGSYRLDNSVQVVDPDGSVATKNVGVFFDFITDFRQQHSNTTSKSLNFNLDVLEIVIPIPIPTIWPGYTNEDTRFRSVVTTKVVQRFGLLEKVTAKDLGSTVETNNLAYDSETGEVLLTKTTTDYNDQSYTMNYPAYWAYDRMGPAYKNIGVSFKHVNFTSGVAVIPHASSYLVPGDELEMGTSVKGWVLSVNTDTIHVEKKNGTVPSGAYDVKVIRSGRRNMQSESMASITTLTNPLNSLTNNTYEKVVASSGVEYNEQWNIFCDCTTHNYFGSDPSNSFVTGARGNWRKKRSFAYLTGRSQSNYDNNTNTRIDGVYTSFNPLYKNVGSKWQLDTTNWTFTSKVTIMNPNGQELENQDPLGRFSAATYGYNQTFATSVAANSRYRELGADNMEDYSNSNCADNHFKFSLPVIDSSHAHTGRRSLRVSHGVPTEMMKVLSASSCEIQSPCDIVMSRGDQYVNVNNGAYGFSGIGAQAPITVSWIVVDGNPTVSFANGQISVSGTNFSLYVTVTGATGCTKNFVIEDIKTGLKKN